MDRVLVSLVVPVYNVENYLRRCLDSLLSQDLDGIEIILVNDGSTDGSLAICRQYQKKHQQIKLINQINKGLGGARNSGIKKASGQYVWFIDSDDYLPPESLKNLRVELERHDYPDVLIFNLLMVTETSRVVGQIADSWLSTGLINNSQSAIVSHNSACNKLFKKQLFDDHQIYFPEKVWYEDLRTVPKLLFYSLKTVRVDYNAYNYVMRQQSITHNQNQARNLEIIDAIADLTDFFKQQLSFESYQDELDFLALKHLVIYASVRLLKIKHNPPELQAILSYYRSNFTISKQNPYLKNLNLKEKITWLLIRLRAHLILSIFVKIKIRHV